MAKELEGRKLLDLEEVKEGYGWGYNTLYYFGKNGLLSPPVKFNADRSRAYWYEDELERIKNRPRSETSKGKGNPNPEVPRIFENPEAAEQLLKRIEANNSSGNSTKSSAG
jgi:hypothetical protein